MSDSPATIASKSTSQRQEVRFLYQARLFEAYMNALKKRTSFLYCIPFVGDLIEIVSQRKIDQAKAEADRTW